MDERNKRLTIREINQDTKHCNRNAVDSLFGQEIILRGCNSKLWDIDLVSLWTGDAEIIDLN